MASTAAGYVRVSTEEQAREGFSLAAQEHLVLERDPDATIYSDVLSGAVTDRPGYQAMLAAAAAGEFDRLLVWKFDRLGRDAEERMRARRMLAAAGVELVSLTGEDASTLYYGIDAVLSQVEREKIAERTKLGLAEVARTGRQPCGQPPLGYRAVGRGKDRVWVIDHAETEILRRIVALYLAGTGVNTIARILNRDGVPPVSVMRGRRQSGRWSPRPILDMLDNPVYVGKIRHAGRILDGGHEPLLDDETWQQIRRLREGRRRAPSRGRPPKRHLLTDGMLRCGLCGGGMAARTFPKTGDYYMCARRHTQGPEACAMPTIRRVDVDDAVFVIFEFHGLDVGASVAAIGAEARRQVDEALELARHAARDAAAAEDRLARVRRDYTDGAIQAADWLELRADLEGERAAACAMQERHEARAAELAAEVDRLDTEERFAADLAEVRRVVLGAAQEAEGLDAARAAMVSMFEAVELRRMSFAGLGFTPEQEATLDGRWHVVPRLRREFAESLYGRAREGETSARSAHLLDALIAPLALEVAAA